MELCAVVNCFSEIEKQGNVAHYKFPVDKTLCRKWLVKCGLAPTDDSTKFRVCSKHFSDEDFDSDLPRQENSSHPVQRNLKNNAEPHLNLVVIKQEPLDVEELQFQEIKKNGFAKLLRIVSLSTATPKTLDNSNFAGETSVTESYSIETGPLEKIESNPVIVSVSQSSVSSSSVAYIPSSLPASQNWPGQYDFAVTFGPQEKNTKGVTWTYSKSKDKLYVGKDVPCPINFSANTTMGDDVSISAVALYSSPEHASEIVHRCVNHSMDELTKGIFEAEHLIRCESSMASYAIDPTTKRHSVIVPFENPPAGQQFSTYIYKFTCFGSCAGGPNRRPLMLIFALEKGGQLVGRRRLDVKICACPGRDRKADETPLMLSNEVIHKPKKRKETDMTPTSLLDAFEFARSVPIPPLKKKHGQDYKNGNYVLKVGNDTINAETRGCYEFLKQMKRFYTMCESMNKLPSGVLKALMHQKKHKHDQDTTDSS